MQKTIVLLSLSLCFSCQINRRSMRESNYQIWLNKTDITYTEQIQGTASQSRIFGIDFKRLFARKYDMGGIGGLPSNPVNANSSVGLGSSTAFTVLGGNPVGGNALLNTVNFSNIIGLNSNVSRVEQFAINDLIAKNPGYDLIMFPQFEVKHRWYVLGSKTHVVVTARLAKLSADKKQ
jgi:hypothetical protein